MPSALAASDVPEARACSQAVLFSRSDRERSEAEPQSFSEGDERPQRGETRLEHTPSLRSGCFGFPKAAVALQKARPMRHIPVRHTRDGRAETPPFCGRCAPAGATASTLYLSQGSPFSQLPVNRQNGARVGPYDRNLGRCGKYLGRCDKFFRTRCLIYTRKDITRKANLFV